MESGLTPMHFNAVPLLPSQAIKCRLSRSSTTEELTLAKTRRYEAHIWKKNIRYHFQQILIGQPHTNPHSDAMTLTVCQQQTLRR